MASERARDLVRKRSGDYRAPETGRHHHIGTAPELMPLLDDDSTGPTYVTASKVQLASRTTAQLGAQAADLARQMGAAAQALDYELAARLRDELAAVESEISRRAS